MDQFGIIERALAKYGTLDAYFAVYSHPHLMTQVDPINMVDRIYYLPRTMRVAAFEGHIPVLVRGFQEDGFTQRDLRWCVVSAICGNRIDCVRLLLGSPYRANMYKEFASLTKKRITPDDMTLDSSDDEFESLSDEDESMSDEGSEGNDEDDSESGSPYTLIDDIEAWEHPEREMHETKTPATVACYLGRLEILALLYEDKEVVYEHTTHFAAACSQGHIAICKYIMENVQLDVRTLNLGFQYACAAGHVDIAHEILNRYHPRLDPRDIAYAYVFGIRRDDTDVLRCLDDAFLQPIDAHQAFRAIMRWKAVKTFRYLSDPAFRRSKQLDFSIFLNHIASFFDFGGDTTLLREVLDMGIRPTKWAFETVFNHLEKGFIRNSTPKKVMRMLLQGQDQVLSERLFTHFVCRDRIQFDSTLKIMFPSLR
ncbi:hypothetical protein M427DRAFT_49022 [Gonapodya prolifera JEL478]|uniref:Ankyrin n=1 Tax=Gonapodya prolifera (strain JEL478) TaxID=1344416 RepID=A0A138ZZY2_GONPJ|nr:hypothetical protein M427DRAFT_49022 [Gonapodya prolifera JEL478]|eukprot:KXS09835.1 hypothetical protein M427DRAFT_49022 [Gonapodya prolifera JEL478]